MKYLIANALAVAAMAPSVALAGSALDNPSGPYIGAGWGRFDLKLHNLGDVGTAVDNITDANDNAWKIFAGYRLNPYWSLEAAYVDFGNPGDRFQATGSGGLDGSYRVKMSGFAPSVVGTLPVGPVELFAKAGYYYYNTETSVNFSSGTFLQSKHTRSDFLYGGGLAVTIFGHLSVRAEYERINITNASNSDALWLSGAWRF